MATPSSSQARQPTGVVLLNGTQVPWTEWEVSSNGFYRADTFTAALPVSALPASLSIAVLSNLDVITVEIRAAVDGSSPTSLILGIVADFDVDWLDGTAHLTGRDHTGDFIETKTAVKYLNQTSSKIIQTLAAEHGLTANVQATTTLAGKYYEVDHDKLTDEITEWDLITYLAQKEGYYAWVSGTVLNFQPAALVQGTPIPIQWTPPSASAPPNAPFVSLKTTRNLTLAGDVRVIVYSWNHKQKQAFKVTATATKSKKSQASGGTSQTYTFRVPGLTHDQAQQWAQNKAEEITRHERLIALELPPDVTTTPRNQIQLTGTGTSWDQLYWIDEVTRRMAWGEFTQTVGAKNHSPQSTVSV